MQVITLNPTNFERHVARLAADVEAAHPAPFDAIVGVRRGGSIVCDAFLRHFPDGGCGKRFDVTLQRPSTKRKEGFTGRILKLLPYTVLDLMRMAESLLLNASGKKNDEGPMPDVEIPAGLSTILQESDRPEILVIDDAIDSGHTLSAIVAALRMKNANAAISIAVMTETTAHPSIRADYTLYRNRTLIRFPWSNDYKNH